MYDLIDLHNNKSLCFYPLLSALNLTLPACHLLLSAGAMRPHTCPQGVQQQTRLPPLLLSIDCKERRTDRQTDGRQIVT